MALIGCFKHRPTPLVVLCLTISLLITNSYSASILTSNDIDDQIVASSDNAARQCATTCVQANNLIHYTPGKTYTYSVDLQTSIGSETELENGSNDQQQQQQQEQNVKITAIADISAYTPCELVLRLRSVQIDGLSPASQAQLVDQLQQRSLHFAYEDGQVTGVCGSVDDQQWVLNVKKSIISALQMTSSDVSQTQTISETDISGQCETIYEPVSKDGSVTTVRKIKQLNKCGQRHQFNVAFFPRSYGLDQVLRSSLPFISSNSTNQCTQQISGKIIRYSYCEDMQIVWPVGVVVASKTIVTLINEQPGLASPSLSTVTRFPLTMITDTSLDGAHYHTVQTAFMPQLKHGLPQHHQRHRYTRHEVEQLLGEICAKVENAVQLDVPVLFSQLIRELHSLSVTDELQLWNSVRNGQLCPRAHKLVDIFLDAAALAGNEGSVEVLIRTFQEQQQGQGQQGQSPASQSQWQISRQRINYLFSLLSFTKQPTIEAVGRLQRFIAQYDQTRISNGVLPRGVLFGITGFVHNLQQLTREQPQQFTPQQRNRIVPQLAQQLAQQLVATVRQCIRDDQSNAIGDDTDDRSSNNQGQHHIVAHNCVAVVYGVKNLLLNQLNNRTNELFSFTNSDSESTPEFSATTGNNNNNNNNNVIVNQLVEILRQNSRSTVHNREIRLAVVQTLANAGIDSSVRSYLIENVIQNESEPIEVKIEAYHTVVLSGASRSQLEQIKRYIDSGANGGRHTVVAQFVNYVRSHQHNLRHSSDPHKRTILPVNAPDFGAPETQYFGISRNYEFSYVNEALGVGVTAETDVIYRGVNRRSNNPLAAQVPQTVAFNLTIPIGGSELQLVEIRLHQHGLEPLIARYIQHESGKILRGVQNPLEIVRRTIAYLVQNGGDVIRQNPAVHFSLQLIVDGKTVVLVDEHDISESDMYDAQINEFAQSYTLDRAFAFIPLDTVIQFPSISGLPVQVRLNSSVVFGVQSALQYDVRDLNDAVFQYSVWPSFAAQHETAVQFFTGPEHKVIEYVHNFYSAPHLSVVGELKHGRIGSIRLDLPESRYTLARIETQVFSRDVHGNRVRLWNGGVPRQQQQQQRRQQQGQLPTEIDGQYGQQVHVCTEQISQALGVVLCYDLSYSTPSSNSIDLIAELSLVKVDSSLSSYQLSFESPVSLVEWFLSTSDGIQRSSSSLSPEQDSIRIHPFKLRFNTPGSQVDREMVFELELPQPSISIWNAKNTEALLRVRTPWKQILARAVARNEPAERVIGVELSVDERQYAKIELALEQIVRGQKAEYRPRLVVVSDALIDSPINLAGTITLNRGGGRKSLLHIQLDDNTSKQQYIKGTFIREHDTKRGIHRGSVDSLVALGGLQAKLASTIEHTERGIKLNFDTDYRLPYMARKHQTKVVLKLQNLSSATSSGASKTLKLSGLGLVKSTQFPEYQLSYAQNLLLVPNQQLEHDLKLGWTEQDTEQIRLYQNLKLAGQRGKYDLEAQAIIIYRPAAVNYELRSTAALIGFGMTGQKRYTVQLTGRSRDDPTPDSGANFQSELAYSLLSKSPLRMKMRATVKSIATDFVYSDEIEESEPGKYSGHLLVQLAPERKYSAQYIYYINNESRQQPQHELDVEWKNSQTESVVRHHGVLRMEPNGFMIRSKLTAPQQQPQQQDIFDGELSFAKSGAKTQFHFNHIPKAIRSKAAFDLTANPMTGQWELSTPSLVHDSSFEYAPKSIEFVSKTKRAATASQDAAGNNILTLDAKVNALKQRLAIDSAPFSGEVHLDNVLPSSGYQTSSSSGKNNQKSASIRFALPNSWQHESSFNAKANPDYDQNRYMLIDINSQTQYNREQLAKLSARYSPENNEHYFQLTAPRYGKVDSLIMMNEEKPQRFRSAILNLSTGPYLHRSELQIGPVTAAAAGATSGNSDNESQDWINFHSLTKRSSAPVAFVDYQYNANNNGAHKLELGSPQFVHANVESNLLPSIFDTSATSIARSSRSPVSPFARVAFEMNDRHTGQPIWKHQSKWNAVTPVATVASADANNGYVFESQTLNRAKNLANIEATIRPQSSLERSYAKIRVGEREDAVIELEHHPNHRSAFKLDTPRVDSALIYEHPEANTANHAIQFNYNGIVPSFGGVWSSSNDRSSAWNTPIDHSSVLQFLAANQRQPIVRLSSRTTGGAAKQNIFTLNGDYRHNEREQPSTFNVELGQSLGGALKLNLFHPSAKSIQFDGSLTDAQRRAVYRHKSDARYLPLAGKFLFNSATEKNGVNIGQIDSALSSDWNEKSYFHFNHNDRNQSGGARYPGDLPRATLEVTPSRRYALVDIAVAPYEHRTIYDGAHQNGYRLFDTNTVIGGEKWAALSAKLNGNQGANELNIDVPRFVLQSLVNPAQQTGSIEYRSKHRDGRHVLANVGLNDIDSVATIAQGATTTTTTTPSDRSYNFDFAWDVDRNPLSKIAINLAMKRLPSSQTSHAPSKNSWFGGNDSGNNDDEVITIFTVQYAQNKLIFNTQLVPNALITNPIRASIAFVPLGNDDSRQSEAWQLVYTHVMPTVDSFQCRLNFNTGSAAASSTSTKYGIELNGSHSDNTVRFGAQTIAYGKPDLEVTVKVIAATLVPGQRYNLDATLVHRQTDQYQVVFDLTKQITTRQIDGKVQLRVPQHAPYLATFSLNLVDHRFRLEVENERNGKQVNIDASYSAQSGLVHFGAKSANIVFFPSVDATIQYLPGEELHAKLDLDQQRKFELVAKYSGELSKLQFYCLTKVNSVYTPSVEFVAEGRKSVEDDNPERSVTISGKYNQAEVLTLKFAQKNLDEWSTESSINGIGSSESLDTQPKRLLYTLIRSRKHEQLPDTIVYELEFVPSKSSSSSSSSSFGSRARSFLKPIKAKIIESKTLLRDDSASVSGVGEQKLYTIKLEVNTVEEDGVQIPLSTAKFLIKSQQSDVVPISVPTMIEMNVQHIPTGTNGWFRVSLLESLTSEEWAEEQQQQQQAAELISGNSRSLFDTTEQTRQITAGRRGSGGASSKTVRTQAVAQWNQKTTGFSLITTKYGNDQRSSWSSSSSSAAAAGIPVEHWLKVYLPVGDRSIQAIDSNNRQRVIQMRCAHQITPELLFWKVQMYTDRRQQSQQTPLYESTWLVQQNVVDDSVSGQTGGVQGSFALHSYKFARTPKVIQFTIRPTTAQRPIDAHVRFDVGQSVDDAVTVKLVMATQKSSSSASSVPSFVSGSASNTTIHLSAAAQNRAVLDFQLDAHVADTSVGLRWKNVNRHAQQRVGQYLFRLIGQNQFEALIANPATRYHAHGVYRRAIATSASQPQQQTSPLVMDFVVIKSKATKSQTYAIQGQSQLIPVSQHQVHVELIGDCLQANIEEQQQQGQAQGQDQQQRQVSICANAEMANRYSIDVETIKNGEKSLDFSYHTDTRSAGKALLVSLRWNPQHYRQVLSKILSFQQSLATGEADAYYDQQLAHFYQTELGQELSHKYHTLASRLIHDGTVEPFVKIVDEEFVPLLEEIGILNRAQLRAQWRRLKAEIEQTTDVIAERFDQYLRATSSKYVELSDQLERKCSRSRACTRLAKLTQILATFAQDQDQFASLITESVVESLQHTHHLVAQTSGTLLRSLLPNSVEQWIAEYIASPVSSWYHRSKSVLPVSVRQFIQHSINTVYQLTRDAALAQYQLRNSFDRFTKHLAAIFDELVTPIGESNSNEQRNSSEWAWLSGGRYQPKQSSRVNWQNVRQNVKLAIKQLLTPWYYLTGTRVLIWDPQNGIAQLEVDGIDQQQQQVSNQSYWNLYGSTYPISSSSSSSSSRWWSSGSSGQDAAAVAGANSYYVSSIVDYNHDNGANYAHQMAHHQHHRNKRSVIGFFESLGIASSSVSSSSSSNQVQAFSPFDPTILQAQSVANFVLKLAWCEQLLARQNISVHHFEPYRDQWKQWQQSGANGTTTTNTTSDSDNHHRRSSPSSNTIDCNTMNVTKPMIITTKRMIVQPTGNNQLDHLQLMKILFNNTETDADNDRLLANIWMKQANLSLSPSSSLPSSNVKSSSIVASNQTVLHINYVDLNLTIYENLTWTLHRSTFGENDSIALFGRTIQLRVIRSIYGLSKSDSSSSAIQLELDIAWTPSRQLVAIETYVYLGAPPSSSSKDLQEMAQWICAQLAPLHVQIITRDVASLSSIGAQQQQQQQQSSELQFYNHFNETPGNYRSFSELYQQEVDANFASTHWLLSNQSFTSSSGSASTSSSITSSLTIRERNCLLWFKLHLTHYTEQELHLCRRITDGCNMAAYFVHRKELIRLPNHCLACTLTSGDTPPSVSNVPMLMAKFGSRRTLRDVLDQAQVVLVLDGSCHRQYRDHHHHHRDQPSTTTSQWTVRFMHQINRLTKVLEREFRSRRIRAKFTLIAPDRNGNYKQIWPQFERRFTYQHWMSPAPQQKTPSSANRSSYHTFMQSIWPSDGRNSLDFLQLYPYPPDRTTRHFVLVDCLVSQQSQQQKTGSRSRSSSRSCIENEIDFSTARTILLHSNHYLHIVTGMGPGRLATTTTTTSNNSAGISPKMRRIIGLDWKQVFLANTTTTTTINNNDNQVSNGTTTSSTTAQQQQQSLHQLSRWLRTRILPHRDICHILALETNGTIFDTGRLLQSSNRRIFAQRLVANLDGTTVRRRQGQCTRCDCMLAQDRMNAHEECTRCKARPHTLVVNGGSSSGGSGGSISGSSSSGSGSSGQVINNDDDHNSWWHLRTKQEWTEEDEQYHRKVNKPNIFESWTSSGSGGSGDDDEELDEHI